MPHSLSHVNATLYIKNNLTIIDSIDLIGEGGSGRLIFEVSYCSNVCEQKDELKLIYNSAQESGEEVGELLFQIDRAHLMHCTSNGTIRLYFSIFNYALLSSDIPSDPGQSKKEVVLTRVFRAVNKGNLPVDVRSIAVNGRKW